MNCPMSFHIYYTSTSPSASSYNSEVQRVKLSLINYIIVVASLYYSSSMCSISAMASSKALLVKNRFKNLNFLKGGFSKNKINYLRFGEVTGFGGVVQYFVVEYGEV